LKIIPNICSTNEHLDVLFQNFIKSRYRVTRKNSDNKNLVLYLLKNFVWNDFPPITRKSEKLKIFIFRRLKFLSKKVTSSLRTSKLVQLKSDID